MGSGAQALAGQWQARRTAVAAAAAAGSSILPAPGSLSCVTMMLSDVNDMLLFSRATWSG